MYYPLPLTCGARMLPKLHGKPVAPWLRHVTVKVEHEVESPPLSISTDGSTNCRFFICPCFHVFFRRRVDIFFRSGTAGSWFFLVTLLQSLVTLLWRLTLWPSVPLARHQVSYFTWIINDSKIIFFLICKILGMWVPPTMHRLADLIFFISLLPLKKFHYFS